MARTRQSSQREHLNPGDPSWFRYQSSTMLSSALKTLHSTTMDDILLEGITWGISLTILEIGFPDILVLCNGCSHIMPFKKLLFRTSLDWKYVAILIKATWISFRYCFQESLLCFFNNALTSTPTFMNSGVIVCIHLSHQYQVVSSQHCNLQFLPSEISASV